MPRPPNANNTHRIDIRVSSQIATYLGDLVALGIHGSTPSEVAKHFVENEVERLIKERILTIRKPTNREKTPSKTAG